MHNKKLLILAAIAAVLIVVGVITKQKPQVTLEDRAKIVSMAPSGLKATDIKKVVISVMPETKADQEKSAGDQKTEEKEQPPKVEAKPLIIEQVDDEWRLPNSHGAPADQIKVDDLIHALTGLKGEFRSDSQEVLADYGLDRESAMTVNLYSKSGDEPVLTLMVGKTTGNNTHFVRDKDSNQVYVVDQDLRTKAGASGYDLHKQPDYKKFVDLTIFTLDKPHIRKISLTSNLVEYSLEKTVTEEPVIPEVGQVDPKKPPEMKKVDKWAVLPAAIAFDLQPGGEQRLISKIERISARDVIDAVNRETDEKYGFNSPEMLLTVSLDDDKEKILTVGKILSEGDKPGDQYPVKVSGLSNVYTVPASALDNLFIKQNDVFDLKLVKLEEADLSGLAVNGPSPYGFTYNEDKKAWEIVDPQENEKINETKLKTIFQVLKTLEAQGFVTKEEPKPDRFLVLTGKNGHKYEFEVDPADRPLGARLVKIQRGKNSRS